VVQQLQEQMAQLQQIKVGLGMVQFLAEDVLQFKPLFLNVEAFVFDFLAEAVRLGRRWR